MIKLPPGATVAHVAYVRIGKWEISGFAIHAMQELSGLGSDPRILAIPWGGAGVNPQTRATIEWAESYWVLERSAAIHKALGVQTDLPAVLAQIVSDFNDEPLESARRYRTKRKLRGSAQSTGPALRFTDTPIMPTSGLRTIIWGLSDAAAITPDNPFGLVHAPPGATFKLHADAIKYDPVFYYTMDKMSRGEHVPRLPIYTRGVCREVGTGFPSVFPGAESEWDVSGVNTVEVDGQGEDLRMHVCAVYFGDGGPPISRSTGNKWSIASGELKRAFQRVHANDRHNNPSMFAIPSFGECIVGAYCAIGEDMYEKLQYWAISMRGNDFIRLSGCGLRLLHELENMSQVACHRGTLQIPTRLFSVSAPYGDRYVVVATRDEPPPCVYFDWLFTDAETHGSTIRGGRPANDSDPNDYFAWMFNSRSFGGVKYATDRYCEMGSMPPMSIPAECKCSFRAVAVMVIMPCTHATPLPCIRSATFADVPLDDLGNGIWGMRVMPDEEICAGDLSVEFEGEEGEHPQLHFLGVRACQIHATDGSMWWVCGGAP